MDIFGSVAPGVASLVSSVTGTTGAVAFSSSSIIPSSDGVIVTGVGYSGNASLQLMQSLGKNVYVYNFGLRDTVLVITGFIFISVCSGGGSSPGTVPLRNMISDFESAAQAAETITISVGGGSFTGLVDSFRTTLSDHRNGSSGFELRLHLIN